MSEQVSMVHWSTDEVPPVQRLDYYSHALSQSIVPMLLGQAQENAFNAHMDVVNVGDLAFINQQGSNHRCFTDRLGISRRSENTFHLILNRATSWNVDHVGKFRAEPGDAVFFDARNIVDIQSPSGFEYLHIKLSESWLKQWIPTPALLAGVKFPVNAGWSRALTAFAAGLIPEFLSKSPLPMSLMIDHLGSLLALATQERHSTVPKNVGTSQSRIDKIKDIMWQMSSSSSLSAAEVALAAGIPLRSFHRCFTATGISFGRTLMDMRCTQAVRMLQAPMYKRLTIGEIALRAGFCDSSHLSVTVRSRTGRTPSQIRKEALGVGMTGEQNE